MIDLDKIESSYKRAGSEMHDALVRAVATDGPAPKLDFDEYMAAAKYVRSFKHQFEQTLGFVDEVRRMLDMAKRRDCGN